VFLPWFSATCAYNIFVDILYANIKVIEYIRSKYRVVEYNISINIPASTARILVIILSSSLVLSKASGSFLYPFIYLSRVLASITIILVFFLGYPINLIGIFAKSIFCRAGLTRAIT
jgi:hypothetical protein